MLLVGDQRVWGFGKVLWILRVSFHLSYPANFLAFQVVYLLFHPFSCRGWTCVTLVVLLGFVRKFLDMLFWRWEVSFRDLEGHFILLFHSLWFCGGTISLCDFTLLDLEGFYDLGLLCFSSECFVFQCHFDMVLCFLIWLPACFLVWLLKFWALFFLSLFLIYLFLGFCFL